MLELPEAASIAEEAGNLLVGKRIAKVEAAHSPHKWAWYHGDPAEYAGRLEGRTIRGSKSWGGLVEISAGDTTLYLGDGASLRLSEEHESLPKKHQLRIDFEDASVLVGSVQMYGGLWACPTGELPNNYLKIAMAKPSPLSDGFVESYFDSLFDSRTEKLSLKAFLATEQRIPGLGNGVLQDILFNAGMHAKRKVATLSAAERNKLLESLLSTLGKMRAAGGRDTEKGLTGAPGGYRTILSRNTVGSPCPNCGETILKSAFMGGSIYYCPGCQG